MSDTITGYHGTRLNYVEPILQDGFIISKNEYDWLGDGAYFFQDGFHLAKEWANKLFVDNGVVIGAKIELDNCMDLVDSRWCDFLKKAHDELLAKLKAENMLPPRQSEGAHRLDRAVINYAIASLERRGHKIQSVRAPFHEGNPLYLNSALFAKSQIQIAVRDISSIKKVWLETENIGRLTND